MGQFRITITAVGGHGCERQQGDGKAVYGCRRMGCPDCEIRRFIEDWKMRGITVEAATLEHWPGTEMQVTDDLVSRVRKGQFPEWQSYQK